MITEKEYDKFVKKVQRDMRRSRVPAYKFFEGSRIENAIASLKTLDACTEFESVDDDGYSELIEVETCFSDHVDEYSLDRIREGGESWKDMRDWWLDYGARYHVLSVELEDARHRDELDSEELERADEAENNYDFEVRVEALESLLVR